MATSSILGGERAATRPSGRDTDLLGPSDSSDSGSDVQNERGFDALDPGEIGGDRADLQSDSDAGGTGERAAAVHDTDIVEGADLAPDRVEAVGEQDIEATLTDDELETLADGEVDSDAEEEDADDDVS
jgi:hypothetical protein